MSSSITNNPITNNSITRPPVVVVLGHIDHGKTTLLDAIRKTKVAEKESGGITQHIGAYQVTVSPHGEPSDDFATPSRKITFIDTPGHEAFSKMRSRGARVADVGLLVVAADEGPKPQTLESLETIRAAKLPFVVVFTKIDKPYAELNKVKGEMMKAEVLLEGLGGDVPYAQVSAQTGEGIEELLELILLVAEMQELKADEAKPGQGVIIEAHRDSRKGVRATLLVKEGTVRLGDRVATGGGFGAKVKHMENFLGETVQSAGVSMPVQILGFEEVPQVGDEFWVGDMPERASPIAGSGSVLEIREPSSETMLPLVIKADVQGSREAIDKLLRQLPIAKVGLSILVFDVGTVSESDVKTAASGGAKILGFRVSMPKNVAALVESQHVEYFLSDIIYELADTVKEWMRKAYGYEVLRADLGEVEILETFKFEGKRMVVGGRVISGDAVKKAKVDIMRATKRVGGGTMVELQQSKVPHDIVSRGNECGMLIEGDHPIRKGDTLLVYREERQEKALE